MKPKDGHLEITGLGGDEGREGRAVEAGGRVSPTPLPNNRRADSSAAGAERTRLRPTGDRK